MGKFNLAVKEVPTIINHAGGQAFAVNPKFELVSILLTSMVKNTFYKSADETLARLVELLPQVGWEFAAKASVYARREFGMRTITHVVGGEVAHHVHGAPWKRKYYGQLFKRIDDMAEVVSYYAGKYRAGKIHPLPNALKRAIADRLSKADDYTLAKYRGEGKAVKLIDLVNLTHPKNGKSEGLKKLVAGELKNTNTWEAKLTDAGQKAETEEQKLELKASAWKEMLSENKMGYLAVIRNVRNVLEQAKDSLPDLYKALVNPEAIKKSLVFPHQIYRALWEVAKSQKTGVPRDLMQAMVTALDLSVANVPKFNGKTLVVIDNSGSMQGTDGSSPIDLASIFGTAIYKSNDADLMVFSDDAKYLNLNPQDSISTLMGQIKAGMNPSGTDFHAIFRRIRKEKYDRIIIFSDMQGWMGHTTPKLEFNAYCTGIGHRPFIYSCDLAHSGSIQFPESQTFLLAGYHEKLFEVMKLLEKDRNALVKEIESINF